MSTAADDPTSERDQGTDPDPGTPRDTAGAEHAPSRPEERADRSPTSPAAGGFREPTPLTQQLGRIAIVVIAVLFGVFAVANSQPVDFSWVFGESLVRPDPQGGGDTGGVPLILLLVAALVMGLALGALIEWQFLRGRRAKKARKAEGRDGA